MAKFTIVRTNLAFPAKVGMEFVSWFLFKCFHGFVSDDAKRWSHFWKRMIALEAGEMAVFEIVHPRSGPYHRRHMVIERSVFQAQDRFSDFEMFRTWLKVGAGWVEWCAGPKGGVVPIPKSISYAEADEDEFRTYHAQVIEFLRGPHAANYLWKHLTEQKAADMMNAALTEFGE